MIDNRSALRELRQSALEDMRKLSFIDQVRIEIASVVMGERAWTAIRDLLLAQGAYRSALIVPSKASKIAPEVRYPRVRYGDSPGRSQDPTEPQRY